MIVTVHCILALVVVDKKVNIWKPWEDLEVGVFTEEICKVPLPRSEKSQSNLQNSHTTTSTMVVVGNWHFYNISLQSDISREILWFMLIELATFNMCISTHTEMYLLFQLSRPEEVWWREEWSDWTWIIRYITLLLSLRIFLTFGDKIFAFPRISWYGWCETKFALIGAAL